jgi:hypothetical protein
VSRLRSSISSARSAPLVVGLCTAGAAWYSAQQRDWMLELASTTNPANNLGTALAAVMQRTLAQLPNHQPADIIWLASPDLMPTWLQTPTPGIRSLQELHALTHARAAQLFGSADSPWLLSAHWQHHQPFLCSAAASSWAANLQGQLTSLLHLLLHQMEPQLASSGWLAITSQSHLHLMYRQHKRWLHLRSMRLPTPSSEEKFIQRVHDEWQREALKTGHATGQLQSLHVGASPVTTWPTNIKKVSLKSSTGQLSDTTAPIGSLAQLHTSVPDVQCIAHEAWMTQTLLARRVS